MTNKALSTFDREMKNATVRKKFEKEYNEFLLSELIISLMQNDSKSAGKLALTAQLITGNSVEQ